MKDHEDTEISPSSCGSDQPREHSLFGVPIAFEGSLQSLVGATVIGYVFKQGLMCNWLGLSFTLEVALFLILFVGVNAALLLDGGADKGRAQRAECLGLLSTMIWGGGIWMAIRIYYLHDPYPGILLWGLSALVMAWMLRSVPQAVLALAIVAQWSFGETAYFREITWGLFLVASSIGFILFRKDSLVLLALVPCVFGLNGSLKVNTALAFVWLGLCMPAASVICSAVFRRSSLRNFLADSYRNLSRILVCLCAVVHVCVLPMVLLRRSIGSDSVWLVLVVPITLSLLCLLSGWLGRCFGFGRDEDWRRFLRELPLYSLAFIAWSLFSLLFSVRMQTPTWALQLAWAAVIAWPLALLLTWALGSRPLWLMSMWLLHFALWQVSGRASVINIDVLLIGLFACRYRNWCLFTSSLAAIWLFGLDSRLEYDFEITDTSKFHVWSILCAMCVVLCCGDAKSARPKNDRLLPLLGACAMVLWSLPDNYLFEPEFFWHRELPLANLGAASLFAFGVILVSIGWPSASNTRAPAGLVGRKHLLCALVCTELFVLEIAIWQREWRIQSGQQVRIGVDRLYRHDRRLRDPYSILHTHITEVPIEKCREGLLAALKRGESRYDKAVYATLHDSADGWASLQFLSDQKPSQGTYIQGRIESVDSGAVTVRYGFERVLLDPALSQSRDRGSLEMAASIQSDGSALVRDVGHATVSLDADFACQKNFQVIKGGRIKNLSNHDVEFSPANFLASVRVLLKEDSYRWSPAKAVVTFNAQEARRGAVASRTLVLRPGDMWRFAIDLNDPSWTVRFLGETTRVSGGTFSSALQSDKPFLNSYDNWSQLEYDPSSSLSSSGPTPTVITQSLRSETVSLEGRGRCRWGFSD